MKLVLNLFEIHSWHWSKIRYMAARYHSFCKGRGDLYLLLSWL
jgi:hypothetical protein